ncbi:mechanosensitive ion channel family protein [Mesorhizobium sp. AR10]|uniref:mechanosensitive ion channel family protein n=1 Tax=Mesorhizobium sp. AR10 TaxID=2865839 RepID=UPI00215FA8D4|nr:mechanosensitive ion channel family protein [Mesorhizobium sp. AR10]UVK36539.1 mechanosensitive ion channel family protein [Mesorhizobium sp. AR10]
MSDNPTMDADMMSVMTGLEQVAERFMDGLNARSLGWTQAPAEFRSLQAVLAASSTSAVLLCLQIVLVVALVANVLQFFGRRASRSTTGGWRRFLYFSAAVVAALAIGLLSARLLAGSGLSLRTLRLWTVATVAGAIVLVALRALLLASHHPEFRHRKTHLTTYVRDLSFVSGWAIAGLALVSTLRIWGAGAGLVDLTGTLLVAIPTLILVIHAIWRHRRTIAGSIAGRRPRDQWRARFARSWPPIVMVMLVLIVVSNQIARTMGAAIPSLAVLLTAMVVFVAPQLDTIIMTWAQRGLESPNISAVRAAGRETARFALVILVLALLGTMWAAPLAAGFGMDIKAVTRQAFAVALIGLLGAFLWNVIGAIIDRLSLADKAAANGPSGAQPSRLGTLVPLLAFTGKTSIVALALLTMLVSVGVNVWPLITGLSVFGLAIGFGSQALVKDVVSGLFFLVDDAFRAGEFIETSGTKGTVEKISIRSVTLRNSTGSLATVPYGQMGKIQNFSRDWVIDQVSFRVALDTDVELVLKLFTEIGEQIAADPEFAPDLLEPFKSKGIADLEDGTLVFRAKFKAKPGKQSAIRRAALKAVNIAFKENGIRAVPKPTPTQAQVAST